MKTVRVTFLLLIVTMTSCEEMITVPSPQTGLVRNSVFEDNSTAQAAMAGVYIKLANSGSFAGGGMGSVTVQYGLYADELQSYGNSSTGLSSFYQNTVASTNSTVASWWTYTYNIVYSCNAILEGIATSKGMTEVMKKQLRGETLFIRAFCYFYLVNLFGDVPYISSTNYTVNAEVSRTAASDVYKGIISDLLEAKALLPAIGSQKAKATQGAAIALLARTYLYAGNYVDAEIQAGEIINSTSLFNLATDPNKVFLKNSTEAIFQLVPDYDATNEGGLFILTGEPKYVALGNELPLAFEAGDARRASWIKSFTSASGVTYHYAYKYKDKSISVAGEYSMVMRLAEQYLIRAEARARLNKLVGGNSAVSDLNKLRTRAGLGDVTAINKEEVLTAIEKERRLELFTEWGHRFFDLKRTGRLDAVLGSIKLNWNTNKSLLPIPQAEMLANGHLTQNFGY